MTRASQGQRRQFVSFGQESDKAEVQFRAQKNLLLAFLCFVLWVCFQRMRNQGLTVSEELTALPLPRLLGWWLSMLPFLGHGELG